ncbi:MAG: sigma-70 family RNA polymerase sigma factor [Erysipelotrichaceae bacterium]|nr:sigma-70 family RNA polymerase sigma factor [Erysipelotrichaceae bacterium]
MKEIEEEKLRENGMDEESIKLLREFDWKMFNADRVYNERQYVNSNLIENAVSTIEPVANNLDDLLMQLNDEELFTIMNKIDHKLTMQIIYLKICGYSGKEIAQQLGMSVDSVYYYLKSARKKLKK